MTHLILHDKNMETLGNGKLLVYLDVNMYTPHTGMVQNIVT